MRIGEGRHTLTPTPHAYQNILAMSPVQVESLIQLEQPLSCTGGYEKNIAM